MRGNHTYLWVLVTDVREPMDRPRPRHVDRRDQGLRRQRTVTQGAVFGAAALAVAFGWVFAQPTEAPATEPAGNSEKLPATKAPSTKAPATKAPATKAPAKDKQPAAEESEEPVLEAPEEAPAEQPEQEQEQQPDARSGGS